MPENREQNSDEDTLIENKLNSFYAALEDNRYHDAVSEIPKKNPLSLELTFSKNLPPREERTRIFNRMST